MELRTKHIKVAEDWEAENTNWSPVHWSRFFDSEQKRKNEIKVISVDQMFNVIDKFIRSRE